jgi:hypothetical protein
MAPRKKQDQLNRTYRGVYAGLVGSSLRNQGFSQDSKGDTYYTVGGVKYDAASGRPVKKQPAKPKPQPTSTPRRNDGGGSTRSGGSGSSSRTYASNLPAVVTRTIDTPAPSRQTGDKQKDMATWAQSNKKLGEALGKRNSERGTSRTTNRLMADLVAGMKKREDAQDQQNGTGKYFGPASPGKSANNSPSAANKFNTTDSLYTPKSKLSDDEERRRQAMGMKNNYGRYTG